MVKKVKVAAERTCQESTITVITTDKYFFLAVKYLIHSMLPEILSEKGILYSVVHCESVFHMNYQDKILNEESLLIADYDVRLIGNSHVLKLMQGMNIFRSIMLVIHKELPLANVDFYLSKGASLNVIKKNLRDFILRPPVAKYSSNNQLLARFTSREHQIIRMILKGKRVESIAKALNVSPKTIYAHRSRIYQKVGVRNLQGLFQHEGLLTSQCEWSIS
ncbi:response regulator transcription factor [Enterobacter hormaechei]|uniref:response regulator transcription factor n=1 Tax=Enterobacter hormaechei TaxID=158836 RepID=UPI0013FD868F|nr:LuxR C-terminal-related transcriptional regulator [Enterobacter hormaechei]